MADRVTCCPHCSTSFRITDAQLQTAKGAVRCGSCLQIFRALDHLLPLPEEQTQPSGTTEEQPETFDGAPKTEESIFSSDNDDSALDISSTAYNRSLFDDESSESDASEDSDSGDDFDLEDDVLISDNMGQENTTQGFSLGELSDDFRDTGDSGQNKTSLFDRKQKKAKAQEAEASDESWAEELLQEMESDSYDDRPEPMDGLDPIDDPERLDSPERMNSLERINSPEPEESDIFKTFGETSFGDLSEDSQGLKGIDPDHTDPLFIETPAIKDHSSGGYDRIATGSFNALDDDTLDSELGESFSSRREPLFSVTGERESLDSSDDHLRSTSAESDETNYQDEEPDNIEHGEPHQSEHDFLLHGIAPAPVEMDWHVETSPWPKRLLWGSLSLLACLGIVAQLAYFKFEEYSRTQPWRQGYATLCPILGCQLPSLSDPRQVKAYNLVVRSNPHTQGALTIDSILLNTANFEQPFPDFALTFSNLQGKQVAYRLFTPQEYLGGEMAGATRMPKGQPVHISLEVVDPGPDAVNYTATIPPH